MVGAFTWVAPCTHVHTCMYCSPPFLVSCVGGLRVYNSLCLLLRLPWWIEEGKEEGECGEGLGRKKEDMSLCW